MGEFNNKHLDLITYSSIYDAKTILDIIYTDNIYKNHSHIYSFLLSEIIKNKAKTKYCLWKQILILTIINHHHRIFD